MNKYFLLWITFVIFGDFEDKDAISNGYITDCSFFHSLSSLTCQELLPFLQPSLILTDTVRQAGYSTPVSLKKLAVQDGN